MFVSHKSLTGRRLATAFFWRGEEKKQRFLVEEEAWAGTELAIKDYGIPLVPVTSYKYLGRVLLAVDDNWPAVVNNFSIECKEWVRLNRVLSRNGVNDRTLIHIYLAVVQSVILYGSETWVITLHIGRILCGFHHRAARRLTGRQPWRVRDGIWVYPHWRTWWRRQDCRRWRPKYPTSRTQLNSLLQPGPLWTCVWWRSGVWGQWWPRGGGIRIY